MIDIDLPQIVDDRASPRRIGERDHEAAKLLSEAKFPVILNGAGCGSVRRDPGLDRALPERLSAPGLLQLPAQ